LVKSKKKEPVKRERKLIERDLTEVFQQVSDFVKQLPFSEIASNCLIIYLVDIIIHHSNVVELIRDENGKLVKIKRWEYV